MTMQDVNLVQSRNQLSTLLPLLKLVYSYNYKQKAVELKHRHADCWLVSTSIQEAMLISLLPGIQKRIPDHLYIVMHHLSMKSLQIS